MYKKEKMLKFIEQDMLLNMVYKDLLNRGHSEDSALTVIYNTYVLDDFEMESIYISL